MEAVANAGEGETDATEAVRDAWAESQQLLAHAEGRRPSRCLCKSAQPQHALVGVPEDPPAVME